MMDNYDHDEITNDMIDDYINDQQECLDDDDEMERMYNEQTESQLSESILAQRNSQATSAMEECHSQQQQQQHQQLPSLNWMMTDSDTADNIQRRSSNDAMNATIGSMRSHARGCTETEAAPVAVVITDQSTSMQSRMNGNSYIPSESRMDMVLHSFERYNKDTTRWRTGDDSSNANFNVMKATEWKKRKEIISANNQLGSNESPTTTSKRSTVTTNCSTTEPQLQQFQPSFTALSYRHCLHIPEKNGVLCLHPNPGSQHIPLTLGDGTRVYWRTSSSTTGKDGSTTTGTVADSKSTGTFMSSSTLSLLGESMEVLIRRVKTKEVRNQLDRVQKKPSNTSKDIVTTESSDDVSDANKTSASTSPMLVTPDVSEPNNFRNKNDQRTRHNERDTCEYQLWVDKHSPKSFAHLLSEERSNREVVRALRAWDPYVFKRPAPPPLPDYYQHRQHHHENINNTKNNFKNISNHKDAVSKKAADIVTVISTSDCRPDTNSRVILLSGPPGVGKTTLAHVIATHCGYRPVEVNGSDERTESSLLDRVIRGMESTTLDNMIVQDPKDSIKNRHNNTNGRPNCLILDEIDGVEARGAIQSIVDIIKAEIPKHNTNNRRQRSVTSAKGNSTKKNSSLVPYLRRPIIFICNNKYAPALKPLLPYCNYQFTVPSPNPARLVARLSAVLTLEKLCLDNDGGGTTPSQLLNQLVSMSSGDIRSCLFTLQFAAASASFKQVNNHNKWSQHADISAALISSLGGKGLKDEKNDIRGVVARVYRKNKEVNVRQAYSTTKTPSQEKKQLSVDCVLDAVKSFGEYSRVLDCLFLNAMSVPYIDPTMDRCAALHEWLSSADFYRSNKTTAEDYGLEALHVPTTAGATHLFCRVENPRDVEFTYSTQEMSDNRYRHETNKLIVQQFLESLTPFSTLNRSIDTMVTDTIPYILWILSAGEGTCSLTRSATSREMLNEGERRSFDFHATILRWMGLTYVVDRDMNDSTKDMSNGYANGMKFLMRLDPPIEKLIQFSKLNLCSGNMRREISSSVKEMICRKIIHDRLRESSEMNLKESVAVINSKVNKTKEQNQKTGDNMNSLTSESGKKVETTSNDKKKEVFLKERPHCNFLLLGAKRAKISKSARSASRVLSFGFSNKNTSTKSNNSNNDNPDRKTDKRSLEATIALSNTGSGLPLQNVIRYKYVKGFTQAVRTPCQLVDLI